MGQEQPEQRAEKLKTREKKMVTDEPRLKQKKTKTLDERQKLQGRPQNDRVMFFTSGNSRRTVATKSP